MLLQYWPQNIPSWPWNIFTLENIKPTSRNKFFRLCWALLIPGRYRVTIPPWVVAVSLRCLNWFCYLAICFIHICIYMYICIYVCMYVYTYVCMYICIYIYVYKINNFAYFFAHSARERQKNICIPHYTEDYKLHIIIANALIRGTNRLNGQF